MIRFSHLLLLILISGVDCVIHSGLYLQVDTGDLVCNVFDYGAVGDGKADDTLSLQSAINSCSTSSGGTVLLPSNGTFLSFEISVPSTARGFALRVEGLLLFSNEISKWKSEQGCIVINGGSDIALI